MSSERIVMKEESLPLPIAVSFRKRTFEETQGLLFQFFLRELFSAIEKSFETLINDENKMNVSLFFALELFFFQLLGSPSSLGMKGSTGSLQKAATYLKHLTILDNLQLQSSFDHLLGLACECYLQYKKNHKSSVTKKQLLLSKSLKKKINTLQDKLQNFASLIEPALSLFKLQETVLLFLLKEASRYDQCLKNPFFVTTLHNLFSEGPSLNAFLLDRYSHKGFYHLLPWIEQKTKELVHV